MENKKYKVVIAQSGKLDVKEKKKYILQQFKYREYAENFSKKIKKAVLALDTNGAYALAKLTSLFTPLK